MLKENTIIRKRRGRARSEKRTNGDSEEGSKVGHPINRKQRVKQFTQSELGPQLMTQGRQTVQGIISRQRRKSPEHVVCAQEPPNYCGPPQVRCDKRWGQSQSIINKGQLSSPRFPPGIDTTSIAIRRGDSFKNGVKQNKGITHSWHQPTSPSNALWNTTIYTSVPVGTLPTSTSSSSNEIKVTTLNNKTVAGSYGSPIIHANHLARRYQTLSRPPVAIAPPPYIPPSTVHVPPDAHKWYMEIFSKIDSGMFFICNEETEKEVFDLKLFALPAEYLAVMQEVSDTTALFLYRKSHTNPVIYGVFSRDGPATLNIVQSAFGRRYPAQIKFKDYYRFPALPEQLLFQEGYQYYPGQSKKLFRVQPQYGSLISKDEIQSIIYEIFMNRFHLAVE